MLPKSQRKFLFLAVYHPINEGTHTCEKERCRCLEPAECASHWLWEFNWMLQILQNKWSMKQNWWDYSNLAPAKITWWSSKHESWALFTTRWMAVIKITLSLSFSPCDWNCGVERQHPSAFTKDSVGFTSVAIDIVILTSLQSIVIEPIS